MSKLFAVFLRMACALLAIVSTNFSKKQGNTNYVNTSKFTNDIDVFGLLPATTGDSLNRPKKTTKPKMTTKVSQAEDRERES